MKIRNYFLSFSALVMVLVAVFFIFQNINKKPKYTPRLLQLEKAKDIDGAVEWLAKLRNNPQTGELDFVAFLKAREEVANKMMNQTKSLGLVWENMGPDNQGGRTRAILIDKNNPNTLYAGGVSGGLWKSTTAGSSWIQVSSVAENLAIACITQSANGTIYVGTGEGLALTPGYDGTNANSGTIGGGIFKSTDGTNFNLIPSTKPTQVNSSVEWALVNRMACDPIKGNRIYAATNKGLYLSENGGDTWKTVKYSFNNTYINMVGEASDVKVGTDGSVVAAVNTRCYTSDNGNDSTYILRSSTATGSLPSSGLSRIEVAIAPSNSSIIYCVAAKTDGSLHNIYRSNDKGVSWYIIAPGGSPNFELFGSNNQGWYDNVIAVFPNNPNMILVGGINMWKGTKVSELGYFSWAQTTSSSFVHVDHHGYYFHPNYPNPGTIYIGTDGGIYRSIDGGIYWQELNKNYNTLQLYAVAFSAQGQVMGGTQDNSTPYISLFGNTPQACKVLWVGDGGWAAFSHINQKVFFATSQYAAVGRSADAGDNWQDWSSFFDPKMLNAQDLPNFSASFVTPLILWESFGDNLSKDSVNYVFRDSIVHAGTKIQARSYNNGYPIDYITTQTHFANDTIRVKDIVQSKFFLGVTGAVWMTKEALDFSKQPKWFKLCSISNTVQSMAYSSDGNYLFVGTQSGILYRISGIQDGYDSTTLDVTSSQTLIQTDNLHSFARMITSISVDPKDANRVIVTLGSYGSYPSWIYFSSNAISSSPTFSAKQGDLPDIPVYASLIEVNNANTVIIGTEYGIFATNNITAFSPTWIAENDGMDQVPVFMIRQQTSNNPGATSYTTDGNDTIWTYFPGVTNYGAIYVGTHGRGFYKCENYVGIEEFPEKINLGNIQLNVFPNPAGDYTFVSFKLQQAVSTNLNVYDLNGRLVKKIDMSKLPAGAHKQILDINNLTKGTYIVQLVTGDKSATSKLVVL